MEFDDSDEPIELGEPDELPMYNQAVNKVKSLNATISRLTAAASNLLAKHRLGAISEADVRWMETELDNAK